ncbi:MAG: sulfite exporter TauE/SafE family protein [Hyphomonadaceae bacterium]|nr:sulfite exporter TauE/SafE family protein [Hyphomonadaceae bacterium]
MPWLAIGFAVVAALYSSVGFGGGSSYTALLVLTGVPILLVPLVSLICNLTVTSAGVWKCWRAGLYAGAGLTPILALSVPAALLGGLTPINEDGLILLLGCGLLLAGLQLGWASLTRQQDEIAAASHFPRWAAPVIGAGVGYLSGLVGIGGGIFLSPILHLVRWAPPRTIAALSSAYIAANSAAALIGKSVSLPADIPDSEILQYWPLIPAVAMGSWLGHRMLLGVFPQRIVKAMTAVLILIVAFRLLIRAL